MTAEAIAYNRFKNLKLAAAELGICWQTLYARLKKQGVPVTGDKLRYGTDRDRLGAMAEAIGKELGFTAATAMRYVKGTQPKPEPKSEPPLPRVATPRRIMNSASRGTYVPDMTAPTRPGAMDYAAVRSRGI